MPTANGARSTLTSCAASCSRNPAEVVQIPRRWRLDDPTAELDAWIDRFSPNEAQRTQLYAFIFDTLCLSPLNFPTAVHDAAMEHEHSAVVPGTRIVVSFLIDREDHAVILTRLVTRD